MPGIPRADIRRHAEGIALGLPLPTGWPATGRAWPEGRVLDMVKKAGWPVHRLTVALPQIEHRGKRAGQTTSPAPQPVAVVPLAWLTELAVRLGCDLSDLIRGIIPHEE